MRVQDEPRAVVRELDREHLARDGAAAEHAGLPRRLLFENENLEDVLGVNAFRLHVFGEADDDARADYVLIVLISNIQERVAVCGVSPTERLDARQLLL